MVKSLFAQLPDGCDFFAQEQCLSQADQLEVFNLFCVAMVADGEVVLQGDFETRIARAGDIFTITPLIGVTVAPTHGHSRLLLCWMRPIFFDSMQESQILYEQMMQFTDVMRIPLLTPPASQAGSLSHLFTYAAMAHGNSQTYQLAKQRHYCGLLFLEISSLFASLLTENKVAARRSHAIYRTFRRLLDEHHVQEHSIGYYAGRLNVTTTYLSRIVRQLTGHTVLEHIAVLLVADAKRLLDCTDLDAKEVADRLCFADATSFGKFFLKHTGMSPQRYRNRLR